MTVEAGWNDASTVLSIRGDKIVDEDGEVVAVAVDA